MNKDIREVKKVVSSIHMGNLLFRNYINRTKDEKLKKELIQILERFESHVDHFKSMTNKYDLKNVEKLNFGQEMVLSVQLMKHHKNDFGIIQEALRGLNMGTLGMLDFVYNNPDMYKDIKDYAMVVLKDYDILQERLHKFSLETYC